MCLPCACPESSVSLFSELTWASCPECSLFCETSSTESSSVPRFHQQHSGSPASRHRLQVLEPLRAPGISGPRGDFRQVQGCYQCFDRRCLSDEWRQNFADEFLRSFSVIHSRQLHLHAVCTMRLLWYPFRTTTLFSFPSTTEAIFSRN